MTSLIQKLREETGAGVMECKRALDEASGDLALAKELIEKRLKYMITPRQKGMIFQRL